MAKGVDFHPCPTFFFSRLGIGRLAKSGLRISGSFSSFGGFFFLTYIKTRQAEIRKNRQKKKTRQNSTEFISPIVRLCYCLDSVSSINNKTSKDYIKSRNAKTQHKLHVSWFLVFWRSVGVWKTEGIVCCIFHRFAP